MARGMTKFKENMMIIAIMYLLNFFAARDMDLLTPV
jgi:hypothetical protein